jgi:hypothetical protein
MLGFVLNSDFPVKIIPLMILTHRHLHVVTRRTKDEAWELYKKQCLFDNRVALHSPLLLLFLFLSVKFYTLHTVWLYELYLLFIYQRHEEV